MQHPAKKRKRVVITLGHLPSSSPLADLTIEEGRVEMYRARALVKRYIAAAAAAALVRIIGGTFGC